MSVHEAPNLKCVRAPRYLRPLVSRWSIERPVDKTGPLALSSTNHLQVLEDRLVWESLRPRRNASHGGPAGLGPHRRSRTRFASVAVHARSRRHQGSVTASDGTGSGRRLRPAGAVADPFRQHRRARGGRARNPRVGRGASLYRARGLQRSSVGHVRHGGAMNHVMTLGPRAMRPCRHRWTRRPPPRSGGAGSSEVKPVQERREGRSPRSASV